MVRNNKLKSAVVTTLAAALLVTGGMSPIVTSQAFAAENASEDCVEVQAESKTISIADLKKSSIEQMNLAKEAVEVHHELFEITPTLEQSMFAASINSMTYGTKEMVALAKEKVEEVKFAQISATLANYGLVFNESRYKQNSLYQNDVDCLVSIVNRNNSGNCTIDDIVNRRSLIILLGKEEYYNNNSSFRDLLNIK